MKLIKSVIVLLGVFLFLPGGNIQAEGTKQWTPTASENTYLKVNNAGSYPFAGYGVLPTQRLHIHIDNPSSEVVYLGFSNMVNEPANTDITTPYTFRIRSPSGAIVHGPFSVTSPNITSHAMAAAGPDALVAGGYPVGGNAMWTFTPTVSGDHYIEFETAGSIRWFDITVANSTISSAIDGRVWSQAWTVRADNGYTGLADAFDTPFTGKFVAYDGKFATQIDFAGSGIRPLEGQFSFNQTGPGSTGDIVNDRKSVDGTNATNPFHKIFLNQPDPSIYPLSPKGVLQNLPLIVVNPADPKVELDVTQPGKIEMVLTFAPGNERRIFADVVAGVNQISWDGKDGNGTTVTINDYPIPVYVSYTQGITHFTAYDVEGLDTGFEVRTQTSTGTIGPNLQFWDDSNIADAPGTADVQVNVDAGAATRRRWNQNNYGDLNTINTWWYAYQGVDTATLVAPGDYGDAPDSYGGAFHVDPANTPVYLGTVPPDVDSDSLNTAGGGTDGTGDDADNTNDEDGINTFPTLSINTSSYTLPANDIIVSNTSGGDATLYGFIDFNNDGDFSDAGESAIANVSNGATQPDTDLVFTGFTMASLEGTTYARFRISTQSGVGPDWVALDGEVEDYPLDIGPDLSNYSCTAEVDVWYANDESGSVSATEFTDALDFIYQVTDEFYHSAADGAQGGLIGWAYDADPTNVVIPITDTFLDPDDTGLASTGTTVDGDGQGVRENYTAKVSASSGTHLANATQGLANRISAGNGRRTGVPQVAVILTDAPNSQINNVADNGGGTAWEAAAANLRAAGPDGVRIAVILLAEAADAYDNDAASRATIDNVVGTDGIVIKTSTYAAAADPANGFIDQTVTQICSVAEFSPKDFSDAPQTGTGYGIAEHTISTGLQLGPTVTEEAAAYDSADAEGDIDDGVRLNGTTLQDQTLNNDRAVTLTVTTQGVGRLHGWIDWDGDGVFGNNANELIISEAANGSGTRTISVTPPTNLT
ncbi:MAG: vWA domain-containing protein, partial [Thiolinea sp.]